MNRPSPAARVYRLFLRLLPRAVLDQHGLEMQRTFADLWSSTSGLGPRSRLIVRAYAAVAAVAVAEWVDVWRGRRAPRQTVSWFEGVLQDTRYVVRSLARQPRFSVMALLALVLGIGLNTSLFALFNAAAIKRWPVADPERVVTMWQFAPWAQDYDGFSISELRYIAEHTTTLEGAFSQMALSVSLDDDGGATPAIAQFVSGSYFELLGIRMELGRSFTAEEDRSSPTALAVLSHAVWVERYGSDRSVVGRAVRIFGFPFTIVGVAPADFTGTVPWRSDLWAPIGALRLAQPNDEFLMGRLSDPNHCCDEAAGRLAKGVSREQAEAELETLSRQYRSSIAKKPEDIRLASTTLTDRPDSRASLPIGLLLVAAVGSILAMACANVMNLLLARSTVRQREIGIRMAIGAGRARVVQQLLTESLLLAVVAGAVGLATAYLLPQIVARVVLPQVPLRSTPDWTVLWFTVVIAVVSAMLFGSVPALRATRAASSETMKLQGLGASPRFPLRGVLLAVQVAVSVTLLSGAGLLIRGLSQGRSMSLGFRTEDIAVVTIALPEGQYDEARTRELLTTVARDLSTASPGTPVGAASYAPLARYTSSSSFTLPGQAYDPAQRALGVAVSPEYFEILGIPVLAGRNLELGDAERDAILINETMARRYWPGAQPVGQTIELNGRREIVGVVRDAQIQGPGTVSPTFFEPPGAGPSGTGRFRGQARVLLAPRALVPAVQSDIERMEPAASVTVSDLASALEPWLEPTLRGLRIAGALSVIALLLAATGIYGVISYSVEQRRREIGIRTALGAQRGQVVRVVLKRNSAPVLTGLAIGLVTSIAASRTLDGLLYGLNRLDPIAYTGVLAVALATALAASVIPARRAARLDAVTALQEG